MVVSLASYILPRDIVLDVNHNSPSVPEVDLGQTFIRVIAALNFCGFRHFVKGSANMFFEGMY